VKQIVQQGISNWPLDHLAGYTLEYLSSLLI